MLRFSIHRRSGLFAGLRADSLLKSLTSSCTISFNDGASVIREKKTNWDDVDPKFLLDYFRRYRCSPERTTPEPAVRKALHQFLFARRELDAPFAVAIVSDGASQTISVEAENDYANPLIVNIPWELADSTTVGREPVCPNDTLAALALARVTRNSSPFKLRDVTRLRVLYCISQPRKSPSFESEKFSESIHRALEDRVGMLTYQRVEGGFEPRFDRLLTEISASPPEILIIVCHGQTNKDGSFLLFDGWKPVSALADSLTRRLDTFLVLLIACDQTYAEAPSAQSGAQLLSEKGIPFVVAMQSSVSARLAADFLGTTIDSLFQGGSIAQAVANGRIQMAPNATAAERIVDWTFPALFAAANLAQEDFGKILKGYVPTLEHLLRRIPAKTAYFFPAK